MTETQGHAPRSSVFAARWRLIGMPGDTSGAPQKRATPRASMLSTPLESIARAAFRPERFFAPDGEISGAAYLGAERGTQSPGSYLGAQHAAALILNHEFSRAGKNISLARHDEILSDFWHAIDTAENHGRLN